MNETVLAIMACHNRRDKTLAAIARLYDNRKPPEIVVVDDGSTDGTAGAIRSNYPEVTIIAGHGNFYWGGGMNRGLWRFLEGSQGYLLWVNDDVELASWSVDRAMAFLREGALDIVVGLCQDDRGEPTYGGRVRRVAKPTSFRLAEPGEPFDTFNGNFVLFTRRVVETLGTIDFPHSLGDFDYGLRAKAAGFAMGMLPEPVGVCPRNPERGTHLDARVPRWRRFKLMLGIKGMPPGPWLRFCLRHAGLLAPIAFLKPYLNVLFKR